MLSANCQSTIIMISIVTDVASGMASSMIVDRSKPAIIHGRRVRATSLAQPKPILAMLAAIAPAKAAIARTFSALSPSKAVARSGNNIVRKGT